MLVRSSLVAVLLAVAGCSSGNEPPLAELPSRPGLAVVEADGSVADATERLDAALADAEGVTVVAEVDHSRNASRASLSLPPTRLRVFGNPSLGTPLMLRNQLAGLDLPQKMLVYQDADDNTIVAYNSTAYLAARYGLAGEPALAQLAPALDGFAQAAARNDTETQGGGAGSVGVREGIVIVDSDTDAGQTYDRLRRAIALNNDLSIIAEVDHQANASRVGLTLRPTRVILFGNPSLGTPLMQASRTAGIDLPQSILVYQPASGPAQVAYEDPGFIAERHGIPSTVDEIDQIRGALERLANAAASDPDSDL